MHSTGAGKPSPLAVDFDVVSGIALCVAESPRGAAANSLRRVALLIGVSNVAVAPSIVVRLWL